MTRHIDKKLNHLLKISPNGAVFTLSYLSKLGYSKQLINHYFEHGWLKKVGHGAYIRLNEEPNWFGAVYAIQDELKLPIHVGGLTALELHGLAQNIALDETSGYRCLFNTTAAKKNLPKWFKDLFSKTQYIQKHLFEKKKIEIGLMTVSNARVSHIPIIVASAERAILEVLSQVPDKFDYAHVCNLVENLRLIRPNLMQRLLQQCLSIKVKRLFLYLADHYQLPCFVHLKIKKIDLGEGKRAIGEGGHYISDYQLSVPKINQDNEGEIGHV